MPTNTIGQIPIDQLQPNPLQPRGKIKQEELEDLVRSITQHGVLEPLVVAHTMAGYQIIAGERRWRAAKVAGLKEVPVVVKETTPRGMLEMAIIENVQRVDLHPLERAKAFNRLAREFHLKNQDIAARVGKSIAYVSNTMRLLSLPDALKDGLLSGEISEGHARALSAIDDTKLMVEAYKIVLKENASVRRAEDIARRMKKKSNQPATSGRGVPPFIISEETDRAQQQLQDAFGHFSRVKITRTNRQTRLIIIFEGDPEVTQGNLDKILVITRQKPS